MVYCMILNLKNVLSLANGYVGLVSLLSQLTDVGGLCKEKFTGTCLTYIYNYVLMCNIYRFIYLSEQFHRKDFSIGTVPVFCMILKHCIWLNKY